MAKYTVIKLKTLDQRLTVVQQPVLASGDVGSVRVEFELDSYWEGYTPSGVFYSDKHPDDVYVQPLASGSCVIPWEVLQEDGNLEIGLRGVAEDGLVKTAAPVRYRIEKGTPGGSGISLEPTPDIYHQILHVAGEAERAAEEAERIAQSIRDDADAGLFNCAVKVAEDVAIIVDSSIATRSVKITRNNPAAAAVPVVTYARHYSDPSTDPSHTEIAMPLVVNGDYLHAFNLSGENIVMKVDVYELGAAPAAL